MSEIESLGKVVAVVRQTNNHGADDYFYKDRYPDAQFYCVKNPSKTKDKAHGKTFRIIYI